MQDVILVQQGSSESSAHSAMASVGIVFTAVSYRYS